MKSRTPFEELYSHFDKLLNTFSYKYNNIPVVEDILQDCYITFFEKYLDKHDPTKSELTTYFINYVDMQCLAYLRKPISKNKLVSMDEPHIMHGNQVTLHDSLGEIIEEDFDSDKIIILNRIISELKGENINRFRLLNLFMDGKSYKEIAELENVLLWKVKNDINLIRAFICKKYSKVIGQDIKFEKGGIAKKGRGKDNRNYYIKNRDKRLAYAREYKANKKANKNKI